MVVIQVNSVAFMPAFGFASAGAIEVGQAIGSRVLGEVGQIVRTTLWVTGIWQLSVGVFYVAFAHPIMTAFTPRHGSAELVSVGAPLLVLSAAWQLFDAVAMTLSEALRAAGDTVWPMVARLLLAWLVFVPAGYWAVGVMGWGGSAAICAVVGYLGLLAAGLAWRYRSGAWRSIDLTGRNEVRG
jgi:MATE family multidrug resistance protein